MKTFILGAAVAFCVSCLTMPWLVKISMRLGAVSDTGGRHVGRVPIGRLGGVGAMLGFISSIAVQFIFDRSIHGVVVDRFIQIVGLFIGLLIVAGIGIWDDIRRLPAIFKLVAQILAALIACSFGLSISGLDLPLIHSFQLGVFSIPITVLWIVGVVNAVNLIDGLDGLAGGVLLFASIVNFAAALSSGTLIPAFIMVAIAGSMLGFLLYNWHPAKIYLGDGGAYSFGYILAVSGLFAPVQKVSTSIALLVPILAIGLPIFDTLLTMLRRFISNRKVFSPDRGHLHHILLDAGISHRRVVIGLYAISCLLGSLSLVIVLKRNRDVGYFLVAASLVGSFFWGVSVKDQLRLAMERLVSGESKSGKGSSSIEE